MKYQVLFFTALIWVSCGGKKEPRENPTQVLQPTDSLPEIVKRFPSPDLMYPELFPKVQLERLYPDSKTFVDAIPKASPAEVNKAFAGLKPGADKTELKNFIGKYFEIPSTPSLEIKQGLSAEEHIEDLWPRLTRQPAEEQTGSSLLPLPYPYIVPGGRFREIYYWDSYFTMLGLAEAGRYDLITAMINNFAYLINTYGHIPNGNRSYYLSRSQPPYFALMVDLLATHEGDAIYTKYLPALEQEYNYWMDGKTKITDAYGGYRRVVKTSRGAIMNRYWDDYPRPRPEAYREDVELAQRFNGDKRELYLNLRAAAESGWDFSTRWTAGSPDLINIHTTFYLPVDLNSLMYFLEQTLAKTYQIANNSEQAKHYQTLADQRKADINEYCWVPSARYYMDYNWRRSVFSSEATAAGVYPLFFNLASKEQADGVAHFIELLFLKDGGMGTTVITSGQQWDDPNGWAPLQWMTYKGLINYGYRDLAHKIATRWMQRNLKVYEQTGKLMEKYNVSDTTLLAGGGEYPSQDGFGWTNGVLIRFLSELKAK